MRKHQLSALSGLLVAIGFISTSTYATVITDPNIDPNRGLFAATADDVSSSLIFTGGATILTPKNIIGGGVNTTKLKTSSLKITGENGTTTFTHPNEIRGGSIFTTTATVNSDRSEVIINDAKFEKGGMIVAGHINEGQNSNITVKESHISLNNVQCSTYLDIVGGSRSYYAGNVNLTTQNSTIKITNSDPNRITIVGRVVGGNMISGNLSQNGSTVKTGNTYIEIGKGVHAIDKVVGGNYVQYFGNAELSGNSTVVIDGGSVTNTVVGGNFVEYTFTDTLTPGPEGSTAPRQAIAKPGSVSTVIVKNGSQVKDVVGGGLILREGANNTDIELQSDASNVKVVIDNSTVSGNVVGAGMIQSSTGVGKVDVKESISVEINNSTVAGVITSDTLDVSNAVTPVVKDTTAAADKVAMKLTNVTANSSVIAKKGAVELRAENTGTTTVEKLDVAQDVKVALTANGLANDAAGGDVTKAISVKNGTFDAKINLDEGFAVGAVTGDVVKGQVVQSTVKEKTNSVMESAQELAANMPLMMTRVLTNDVRKRMGDLRAAEGKSGAWARYDGGKFSGNSGLDTDFHTIQVGVDTVPTPDSARFGIAFSYTDGESEHVRTQSDMTAFSLAGYATWMAENGLFVDGVVRMAKVDNDITIDGKYKGTMDNFVLSVSGETGYRFDLNDKFYVEPQAEVMYTYVDGDQFDIGPAQYEINATDSLTGRLGFASGIKCPNQKGDLYVRASVVHEFLGDSQITGHSAGTTRVLAIDGKDTWVEYGFGGNFNLTKSTYLWADVERTSGSALETDYRATIGVRHAF